jgi:hypothetical protein
MLKHNCRAQWDSSGFAIPGKHHTAERDAPTAGINDAAAFVHLDRGAGPGHFSHIQALGGSFGTSSWTPGERVEEPFVLTVPEDAPLGAYWVRVVVGLRHSKRQLRLSDPGRPGAGRYTATIATLTVVP